MAWPPPVASFPDWVNTHEGEELYGDLSSFRRPNDGNVYAWKSVYFHYVFYHGQKLEFDTFFDPPSSSYSLVWLTIKVKYVACTGTLPNLILLVRYQGGSSDRFEISDTGGAYVQKTFTLDSYKRVWVIEFAANYVVDWWWPCDPNSFSYVYIDYLVIGYENWI